MLDAVPARRDPDRSRSAATAPDARRVCVGVVLGAHGIRGAVRIRSFTVEPAAIAAYGAIENEAGTRRLHIDVVAVERNGVRATIRGVGDRTAAHALKGAKLYVSRSALPAPHPGEYYATDLEGLAVVATDGAPLGRVVALHDFGAGSVLEIEPIVGDSLMVPFTDAAVPAVDIAGARVTVAAAALDHARPAGKGGKARRG